MVTPFAPFDVWSSEQTPPGTQLPFVAQVNPETQSSLETQVVLHVLVSAQTRFLQEKGDCEPHVPAPSQTLSVSCASLHEEPHAVVG